MSTISCVIIDDEPIAAKGLKNYVDKIPFLNLIGTCEDALELGKLLDEHQVDVLFLDIQMPFITGTDFIKTLKNPPMVVFTTAYSEYALEGYELDVLDYLLKPISFQRFLKAANKAKDVHTLQQQAASSQEVQDYFFVKVEHRLEKVRKEAILYVESLQNYIVIHTTLEEKLIVHLPLKNIKAYLSEDDFIQPHRSYIVAIDKIKAIEGNQIIIPEKHYIPISKHLKEDVLGKIVNQQLSRKK